MVQVTLSEVPYFKNTTFVTYIIIKLSEMIMICYFWCFFNWRTVARPCMVVWASCLWRDDIFYKMLQTEDCSGKLIGIVATLVWPRKSFKLRYELYSLLSSNVRRYTVELTRHFLLTESIVQTCDSWASFLITCRYQLILVMFCCSCCDFCCCFISVSVCLVISTAE